MSEHSRDWWLHESEHVLVVLLLAAVLLLGAHVSGGGSAIEGDPVVIVPASDAFTVYTGQTITFPWLVVNRLEEPLRVRSGIALDWTSQQNSSLPNSVTSLLVKPEYIEMTSLNPGDHKEYEYSFTAPDTPGRYRIHITVESGGEQVEKTVVMRVVER